MPSLHSCQLSHMCDYVLHSNVLSLCLIFTLVYWSCVLLPVWARLLWLALFVTCFTPRPVEKCLQDIYVPSETPGFLVLIVSERRLLWERFKTGAWWRAFLISLAHRDDTGFQNKSKKTNASTFEMCRQPHIFVGFTPD